MQRKLIIILLIFLFVLPGCAFRVPVKKVPPGTSLTSLKENVLVFGRVRWIQNEEEIKSFSRLGNITTGFKIALQILRVEDMKTGSIFEVEKDGLFFALLPIGTYVIHRLDWGDFWGGGRLVPKVAFQGSKGQHSYYLGTLVVDVKTKRNIFGDQIVKGLDIYIEDEEDKMMEAFRKRYPRQEIKVTKALMVHDPSIPRIDELENQYLLLKVIQSLQFGLMPTLYP